MEMLVHTETVSTWVQFQNFSQFSAIDWSTSDVWALDSLVQLSLVQSSQVQSTLIQFTPVGFSLVHCSIFYTITTCSLWWSMETQTSLNQAGFPPTKVMRWSIIGWKHITSHHTILQYNTPYYTILHHITPHYITPYHNIPYTVQTVKFIWKCTL